MEQLPYSFNFLPFTSDYGFKLTFGNEHNTLFLRRALQALLALEEPITEVHLDKDARVGPTKHRVVK